MLTNTKMIPISEAQIEWENLIARGLSAKLGCGENDARDIMQTVSFQLGARFFAGCSVESAIVWLV